MDGRSIASIGPDQFATTICERRAALRARRRRALYRIKVGGLDLEQRC